MKVAKFTGNCQTVFNAHSEYLGKRFWIALISGTGGSVSLEFSFDHGPTGWFPLTSTPLSVDSVNTVDYTPISTDAEMYFRATSTGFGTNDVCEIHVTGGIVL